MTRILMLICIISFVSCKMNEKQNKKETQYPFVIRTDFTTDSKWRTLNRLINKPEKENGFKAYVDFINDKKYENNSYIEIRKSLFDQAYSHSFFFIADSISMNHKEKLILCVSMQKQENLDRFRVIPKDMWAIENNLSTANLLFDEFLYSVDTLGIYRMEFD